MGDDKREECGIAAVFLKDRSKNSKNVPKVLDRLLTPIQRRGQSGTGVAVYRNKIGRYGETMISRKKLDTVEGFFGGVNDPKRAQILKDLKSISGIGHVRYVTSQNSGKRSLVKASLQPFYRRSGRSDRRFAFAFNGNIANYPELEDRLESEGFDLQTGTDTELMMHTFSSVMPDDGLSFFEIMKRALPNFDGAYSISFLSGNGDIGLARDPNAFKPLVYGENDHFFAAASESVSLSSIGITDFKIVPPGYGVLFDNKGVTLAGLVDSDGCSHCHFEATYFSDVASHFEDMSIHDMRSQWGINLATNEPYSDLITGSLDDVAIVPVPHTPVPTAASFAKYFGTSFSDAIKKVSSKRGFIAGDHGARSDAMNRNYQLVAPGMLRDKHVFLVEDSIVRSQTIKKIVKMVRECDPKGIHVRVIEPPIRHPCFYGISFATYGELVAAKYSDEELNDRLASEIGADSVRYQVFDDFRGVFGDYSDKICTACLSGDYPTEFGTKRASEARKQFEV